jgi:hypothetical protein
MSGAEDRSPQSLANELAETRGAIPVLVTLQDAGGESTREALAHACDARTADDAIRWLAAVCLIRRHDSSGTYDFDEPGTRYELTSIGASLTRSLTDLSAALAGPAEARGKAAVTEDL